MKSLIVNADEFGLTEGVNRAIIEAHRQGIVTSTTLVPNLWAFQEAADLTLANPDLGVGVHLNLTDGRPVSPPSQVSALVDGDGRFLKRSQLLKRLFFQRVPREQIVREFTAQIERSLHTGSPSPTWTPTRTSIYIRRFFLWSWTWPSVTTSPCASPRRKPFLKVQWLGYVTGGAPVISRRGLSSPSADAIAQPLNARA